MVRRPISRGAVAGTLTVVVAGTLTVVAVDTLVVDMRCLDAACTSVVMVVAAEFVVVAALGPL